MIYFPAVLKGTMFLLLGSFAVLSSLSHRWVGGQAVPRQGALELTLRQRHLRSELGSGEREIFLWHFGRCSKKNGMPGIQAVTAATLFKNKEPNGKILFHH